MRASLWNDGLRPTPDFNQEHRQLSFGFGFSNLDSRRIKKPTNHLVQHCQGRPNRSHLRSLWLLLPKQLTCSVPLMSSSLMLDGPERSLNSLIWATCSSASCHCLKTVSPPRPHLSAGTLFFFLPLSHFTPTCSHALLTLFPHTLSPALDL